MEIIKKYTNRLILNIKLTFDFILSNFKSEPKTKNTENTEIDDDDERDWLF